ncbi:hypothetical protein C4D60_Mb01t25900 [Musa balbisiana]|uniref:Uncharacterized protein n=1 Tax=Musa balbisiana TaxID=52838 RepID=A0A4S8JPW5_MUSBA|nr:hypothetical protein C4D60_Mb01t25900 [Musa balbisiana]
MDAGSARVRPPHRWEPRTGGGRARVGAAAAQPPAGAERSLSERPPLHRVPLICIERPPPSANTSHNSCFAVDGPHYGRPFAFSHACVTTDPTVVAPLPSLTPEHPARALPKGELLASHPFVRLGYQPLPVLRDGGILASMPNRYWRPFNDPGLPPPRLTVGPSTMSPKASCPSLSRSVPDLRLAGPTLARASPDRFLTCSSRPSSCLSLSRSMDHSTDLLIGGASSSDPDEGHFCRKTWPPHEDKLLTTQESPSSARRRTTNRFGSRPVPTSTPS